VITNAFELLCYLAEASASSFRVSALDHAAEPLQVLQKLGAIGDGPRPTTVTCS
jgi:hypothetical protein